MLTDKQESEVKRLVSVMINDNNTIARNHAREDLAKLLKVRSNHRFIAIECMSSPKAFDVIA